MKYLITGHKGFIGSNLFKRCLDLGLDVHGIDLKNGDDIRHFSPKERYDVIFHLAAQASIPDSFNYPL